MDSIHSDFHHIFGWVPLWFLGLCLVAGAIIAALLLHCLAIGLMRRAVGKERPVAMLFLDRTAGPTRLAICLLAVALVLPLAPLDDEIRQPLSHLFAVAVIALIGWISTRAVDMAAGRYLQRFRADVTENFLARKHVTQVRVFKRVTDTLIVIVAVSTALMTFSSVRQYGVSLFASAGAAGLIVGLAARPLLSNLIAGVQIAVTQPIRIEDAVIIENEWGWVEDIASTYVVVRLWDWRRMVVPLSYFIERPFQNWTRSTMDLVGSVQLVVDYSVPVDAVRQELRRICEADPLWDHETCIVQVTAADRQTLTLRALVSADDAANLWNLKCRVREYLAVFCHRMAQETAG